jgi:regulator of RNase E activity RraA
MKYSVVFSLFLFVAMFSPAAAQVIDKALLAKGMNFIETKTYTVEDDGDGVVVVPRAVAEQVAKYANEVLKKDKAGRKGLYESLGRPLDKTVKQE